MNKESSAFRKYYSLNEIVGIALAIVITVLLFLTTYQNGEFKIVDIHEHVENLNKAEILLKANKNTSIIKTVFLPSPEETLTLNGRQSFTKYKENFDSILEISNKYPNSFIPLCTVSPTDPNALEYFKECIQQGGKGLKLYNGHSYYYEIFNQPLNSSRMMPIYAFAERNHLPVLFHINISKYEDELRDILTKYPDLVVNIPHFMVSSIQIDRVKKLLDDFPNLYTDISFGSPEFLAAGLRRISNDTDKYRSFINEYSDRVLFGTDMVLTEIGHKDQNYMEQTLSCYRNILEKSDFECKRVSDYYLQQYEKEKGTYDKCQPKVGQFCEKAENKLNTAKERYEQTIMLNGLYLTKPVLKRIYEKNPERFLSANQI